MVKEKMMPSSRLCKPRSNETVFMVFLVSYLEGGFSGIQIYLPKVKNDLNTTCWCGGSERKAENGDSIRPEAYTEVLGNTIPWYCWGHEWRRA
jgi:hypothetical protein